MSTKAPSGTPIHASMPDDLVDGLNEVAEATGEPRAFHVRQAVREYLERRKATS